MKRYKLAIKGHVPSKKNRWAHGNGRVFIKDKESADITALETQIRLQSRDWPIALRQPRIVAEFTVRDQRGDLDNKWTTLQDCLVAVGVIDNDNIKHLPGPLTLSARVGTPEGVTVELIEGGAGMIHHGVSNDTPRQVTCAICQRQFESYARVRRGVIRTCQRAECRKEARRRRDQRGKAA